MRIWRSSEPINRYPRDWELAVDFEEEYGTDDDPPERPDEHGGCFEMHEIKEFLFKAQNESRP